VPIWIDTIMLVLGSIVFLVCAFFAVGSWFEREIRAAGILSVLACAAAALFLVASLVDFPFKTWVTVGLLVACGGALLVVLFPIGGRLPSCDDVPRTRIDERDIMFARARLNPGGPEYEQYYALHSENKSIDDKIRAMPGLSSPQAALHHPLACAAMDASFEYIALNRQWVDGPIADQMPERSVEEMTAFIKGVTRLYGAHSVGITELQDYHVYSHVGRGEGQYGAPIDLSHLYAIAFTVEMDFGMIRTAPAASETMEVASQYANAAQVALQLALLIRSLGYPARAHIDGSYRVVGPLVARDAGLGEIGRMGILMTPDLGPRVRLSFVTTDLPLLPDGRVPDPSVVDLCRRCTKCADNCPSRSIPAGDRQEIDGAWRWRINSETCFSYWNQIGTDCGRCIAVCPYAHPDTLVHRPIRWAARRSALVRRVAPWLDDVFYGRRPAAWSLPSWLGPCAATRDH
jgi:ferredoxin